MAIRRDPPPRPTSGGVSSPIGIAVGWPGWLKWLVTFGLVTLFAVGWIVLIVSLARLAAGVPGCL